MSNLQYFKTQTLYLILGLLFLVFLPTSHPQQSNVSILLHALPHTHLDAGWVESYDTYYEKLVNQIIDNLLVTLESEPSLRFNWSEITFLQRWWQDQDKFTKNRFIGLFNNKQIYFVGGGQVQHDEATVEYYNALQQLESGWAFLKENFNFTPHVGWQLDSFGYSQATPTLLSQFGIDTLFITRVPTHVKDKLREEGQLQFIWQGHTGPNKEPLGEVFVQVNQADLYTVTNKLQYDVIYPQSTCSIDDLRNETLECLDILFIDQIKPYMNTTDKNNVISDQVFHIPMLFGDDFTYFDADHNFKFISELSQLMSKYSKQRYGIQIDMQYSTVEEYLQAISGQIREYPKYQGDFLPYLQQMDCETALNGRCVHHWTGYYSTKPVFKQHVRDMFKQLRSTQKMFALINFAQIRQSSINKNDKEDEIARKIQEVQDQASILLHHDAITGTHSISAYRDYVSRMAKCTLDLESINKEIDNLIQEYQVQQQNKGKDNLKIIISDILRDQSILEKIQMEALRVFNPSLDVIQGKIESKIVPRGKTYVILDQKLEPIKTQFIKISDWNTLSSQFFEDQQNIELLYSINEQKPLAQTAFLFLTFENQDDCIYFFSHFGLKNQQTCENKLNQQLKTTISNSDKLRNSYFTQIQFDDKGMITFIQTKENQSMKLEQKFLSYNGKNTRSGLYIFNPLMEAETLQYLSIKQVQIIQGDLVNCISVFSQQTKFKELVFENKVCLHLKGPFQDHIHQTLKAYTDFYDELVIRTVVLYSNYKASSLNFYTDDSIMNVQRQIIPYQRAKQLGLDLGNGNDHSMIGLNSYPCNTGMILEDENNQLGMGIAVSHSMLCNLVEKNTYEMMLVRSLSNNDEKGLPQTRNFDTQYSSVDLVINFSEIGSREQASLFYQNYNKGKFLLNEKFTTTSTPISTQQELLQLTLTNFEPFSNPIISISDAEFFKTTHDIESDKTYFYLRSVHPSGQTLQIPNINDMKISPLQSLSTLEYISNQSQMRYSKSGQSILEGISQRYETFENKKVFNEDTSACQFDSESSTSAFCLNSFFFGLFYVQPQNETPKVGSQFNFQTITENEINSETQQTSQIVSQQLEQRKQEIREFNEQIKQEINQDSEPKAFLNDQIQTQPINTDDEIPYIYKPKEESLPKQDSQPINNQKPQEQQQSQQREERSNRDLNNDNGRPINQAQQPQVKRRRKMLPQVGIPDSHICWSPILTFLFFIGTPLLSTSFLVYAMMVDPKKLMKPKKMKKKKKQKENINKVV